MADIFLSYSREDEARIKPLVSEFEAQGWSVFWDRRIPAGETWRSYIGSALKDAHCIVVAWSKYSIESQWVIEEADEGRERKVLVPLLLDKVQPPHGFRGIQAADISDWHAGESSERFDELVGDLKRVLGTQSMQRQAGVQPREHTTVRSGGGPGARLTAGRKRLIWSVVIAVLFLIGAIGYMTVWMESAQNLTDGANVADSRAGSWLVIAGSYDRADWKAAEQRQSALESAGFDAQLIDSDQYPGLSPNLLVVVLGPVETKESANQILSGVQRMVHDAYVKKAR